MIEAIKSFFYSLLSILHSIWTLIKSIIFLAVLLLLVIFMVQNREMIVIHFNPLPFEIEARVFLVMSFFFVLGLVFSHLLYSQSLVIAAIRRFRDKMKIKKLEKIIEEKGKVKLWDRIKSKFRRKAA
jgi:uncharacterized membrane protein YciS (DUF1049 family)